MDLNELIKLHKRQRENTRILDPEFQIQRHPLFVRFVGPTSESSSNGVEYTNLDFLKPDAIQDFVRSQVIFFKNLRKSFRWKLFSYDYPPHLADLLLQEGFQLIRDEQVMVKESSQAIEGKDIPGIEIRELEDDFAALALVQKEVWSYDPTSLIESLAREKQIDPQSLRLFAAFDGNEPVSCAWIRMEASFGVLLGGSVREAWRGRGIYQQLVNRRMQIAQEKGLRYVSSDAGSMSAPILKNLGFEVLADIKRFEYTLA